MSSHLCLSISFVLNDPPVQSDPVRYEQPLSQTAPSGTGSFLDFFYFLFFFQAELQTVSALSIFIMCGWLVFLLCHGWTSACADFWNWCALVALTGCKLVLHRVQCVCLWLLGCKWMKLSSMNVAFVFTISPDWWRWCKVDLKNSPKWSRLQSETEVLYDWGLYDVFVNKLDTALCFSICAYSWGNLTKSQQG